MLPLRRARLSGILALLVCVGACASDKGPAAVSSPSSAVEAGAPTEASAGDAGAAPLEDGGPPGVQLIGRFDSRDARGPTCAWPGCRIIARFEKSASVSVTLSELAESWMDGAPSEWDVAVDDVWQPKLVTANGTKTYPIASGLSAGPHTLELYKRSEAQNGVTQFLGFDLGGGVLLSPPPRLQRKIEILGDSVAAGFGVEGVGFPDNDCPGLDYSAAWQNYRKSFGAVLGGLVDAEVHGTVYSGKGLVKNIYRPDTEAFPELFARANPADRASVFDLSAWQPDAVVLMIGGNDFAEGQPDESNGGGPATLEEFTTGYRAFVDTLRAAYPNAHLFLATSPSTSDEEPAGRQTRTNILAATSAVATARSSAGDARVYAVAPGVAPKEELTACNGHGTPAFHARVASEMAVLMKQKLGW